MLHRAQTRKRRPLRLLTSGLQLLVLRHGGRGRVGVGLRILQEAVTEHAVVTGTGEHVLRELFALGCARCLGLRLL